MLNDVLMSEAGAARDGLHVAIIATGFNKITVESDSIDLISLLNSRYRERSMLASIWHAVHGS